jgi:radical SAM/Cys-rich protein
MDQLDQLSRAKGESFTAKLRDSGLHPLRADGIEILQLNITRRCNLACKHCHVQAGPHRTETMSRDTLEQCMDIARRYSIPTVDITGGAPETHPDLEWFLRGTAALKRRIIVRSNLVILLEEPYRRFLDVYAQLGIEVVGSVPDYRQDRTDRQRGVGAFEKSVQAIRLLNERGYGMEGTGLVLDLVHNPAGAFLPGSQPALEHEYKTQLHSRYGIVFNKLFCLTNCPVGRYLDYLVRTDNLNDYMGTLRGAYNPAAARNVMCRTTLSVGWDGTLFDCDFNQMLGLPVNSGAPVHIRDFDFHKLRHREIVVRDHCFACTAGAGSSCQGALE